MKNYKELRGLPGGPHEFALPVLQTGGTMYSSIDIPKGKFGGDQKILPHNQKGNFKSLQTPVDVEAVKKYAADIPQTTLEKTAEWVNRYKELNKTSAVPNGPGQEEIKTAPERQSYLGKAANVFTNPVTALGYVARNQEIPDNMPRTNPFDYAADAGKLALGLGAFNSAPVVQALGTNIGGVAGLTGNNLINAYFAYEGLHNSPNVVNQWKNVNNVNDATGALINTGLTTLAALPLGMELAPGIKSVINASKEKGVLSNVYKYNPWKFKEDTNAYYRMLGEEGYAKALADKKLKGTEQYNSAFYSKGYPMDKKLYPKIWEKENPGWDFAKTKQTTYDGPYMAEIKNNDNLFVKEPGWNSNKDVVRSIDDISLSNPDLKIYKKDWLKGYKQVDVPTNSVTPLSNFKSEIDWGKWNKEIPDDKVLMQEYNAIEQTSKANGTWMKNTDGTPFTGTPEQFIQMNSKDIISYSGGSLKTSEAMYKQNLHRGAHQHIDDFANRDRNDYATFLTDSKVNSESYAGSDGLSKPYYHPDINKSGEWTDGIYHLGIPQNLPKVVGEAKGRTWRLLDYDENVAKNIGNNAEHHNEFLKKNQIKNTHQDVETASQYDSSKNYLSTDNYATYVKGNKEAIAQINNVKDQMGFATNIPTNTVYAVDANRIPLKSLMYNNGRVDITNPNIYKSVLLGAVGTGVGATALKQQKNGGDNIHEDNNGYWNPDNWGKPVKIGSNDITMKGVNQPLYGVSNTGDAQYMIPGQDYKFHGDSVIEYPVMQNGGVPDYTTSNYSDYVNRKQAYNDSLNAFNSTNFFRTNLNAGSTIKKVNDPDLFYQTKTYETYLDKKIKPNEVVSYGYTKEFPLYKKPTQPVTFVPDPTIVAKQKLIGVNPDGIWGTKSEAAWKNYNNKPQTISQPTTSRTSTIESPKQIIPVQPVIDVDAVEKKYMRYFDNGQKPEYWYQIKDKSGKLHSMSEIDYNIIKNKKQIGGDPSVPSIGNQKINPGFYNEGGELSLPLSVYKNYVNGVYNNTPVESHGKSVYDKMNRVHLAEAKKNKMNVTNYIMSNIS